MQRCFVCVCTCAQPQGWACGAHVRRRSACGLSTQDQAGAARVISACRNRRMNCSLLRLLFFTCGPTRSRQVHQRFLSCTGAARVGCTHRTRRRGCFGVRPALCMSSQQHTVLHAGCLFSVRARRHSSKGLGPCPQAVPRTGCTAPPHCQVWCTAAAHVLIALHVLSS